MRKLLLAVLICNAFGAMLNMFGSLFDVGWLTLVGGVFVITAFIGAIVCLIKSLR